MPCNNLIINSDEHILKRKYFKDMLYLYN